MDDRGLIGELTPIGTLEGVLSGTGGISGGLSVPEVIANERYRGSYQFTPTEQTQEIQIADKTATQNIIIAPIPQNYGLITYNGVGIRVS